VNKKEYARVSILLHKKSNNKTLKITVASIPAKPKQT
jgi:hypothetical protein